MKKLTFVGWYNRTAVYLGDDLIAYLADMRMNFEVLRELGFEPCYGEEIPTHNIPEEFDMANRWWAPPAKLSTLLDQQRRYKLRLKRESLQSLEETLRVTREEIRRLENEPEYTRETE